MQHPQNLLCRVVLGTIAGGFVLAVAPAALAHAWPSKPFRLVFTGAPGGSADVVAHAGPRPEAAAGQSVIVDNKRAAWALSARRNCCRHPSTATPS